MAALTARLGRATNSLKEPPGRYVLFVNQQLAALAKSLSSLSMAQFSHSQSSFGAVVFSLR
jgi:hypothetical protein